MTPTDPQDTVESSATEPSSVEEWLASIGTGDDEEVDIEADVDLDEEEATSEPAAQPVDEAGDDLEPQEGDAETREVGSEDDTPDEPVEEDDAPEPGEAEAAPEPTAEAPSADAADVDPQSPDDPGQQWEWTPARLKADRVELDVPGALQAEGVGLFIPAESIPKLQSHLANRGEWERERQRLERERDAAKQSAQEEREAAKAVVEFWAKEIFALPADERWAAIEDLEKNQPIVEARAKAAAAEARATRLEAAESARHQAEQAAEDQRWAEDAIVKAARVSVNVPAVKDLGLDESGILAKLVARHERDGNLFLRADEEFVRSHPHWALKPGDRSVNWDVVHDVLEQELRDTRAELSGRQAVEQAKAKNESKRKKKLPPRVRAEGNPIPKGKQAGEPTSEQEWLDSLKR